MNSGRDRVVNIFVLMILFVLAVSALNQLFVCLLVRTY